MKTHNHFNHTVPNETQDRMYELAELAKDELIAEFDEVLSSCDQVDEISGVERSGFIPFQDGGFEVTAWYTDNIDEPSFSEAQLAAREKQYDRMRGEFAKDHSLSPDEDIPESLQDDFYDYEREYMDEPVLLTFQVYAYTGHGNFGSGLQKGVTVALTVNYRDAPNYRPKYADTLLEKTFSFKEFMETDLHSIIQQFKNYPRTQP